MTKNCEKKEKRRKKTMQKRSRLAKKYGSSSNIPKQNKLTIRKKERLKLMQDVDKSNARSNVKPIPKREDIEPLQPIQQNSDLPFAEQMSIQREDSRDISQENSPKILCNSNELVMGLISQVKALQEETSEMKALLLKMQVKIQEEETKIAVLEKENDVFKEFCKKQKKKKKKAIKKRRLSEVMMKEEEQTSKKTCKAKTRSSKST